SDATSTATLAAALSGSVAWSTASVVLSPSTGGVVVSPTAATITTTGGTPNIPGNPVTVTPSGATIAATGGTPGLIETPLNPSRTKLLNGQDSVRLGIGDSTLFSAEDTGFSELTTPWTPGNLRGWLGREAIEEANEVDATVIAYTWNYPTNTGYTGPATLRSGSGPTLTVYVGGWPGGVMADYIAKPAMLADVNPDVVFIQDGFNETNATTFATNMNTYIGTVQSTYPGVPIIVTTANATTATSESGHPTFATLFAAMITSLLPGKSLPLSPPLQLSSPGVWVIDTQQADLVAADLFTDGLHPIGQGYDKQANYMAWVLAGIERTATPDSATISITPGTPAVTAPTVISPTSAAVSSSGGSPDIEQTGGSTTATPSSAVITTTPGTPVIEQSGPITVTPNAAHITTTAGTPTVLNSSTPPDVAPENTVLVRAESRRVLV
ncbi:MAG TPA: hypothetical protein VFQ37_11665, partial [Mycobacterium sp.]|nr:hypothetical protein [Mycobacterium sp.]